MTDSRVNGALTERDLEKLSRSFITPELAHAASIRRVDSNEGAQIVGKRPSSGDYAGLVFPFFWPGAPNSRDSRLRRDNPDLEQRPDGTQKERDKYLAPPGRRNMLYVAPDTDPAWLDDPTIPADITEGEKKTLALARFHVERSEPVLALGLCGVWNWRGTIGKTANENGKRVDVKGVIPDFDRIAWNGREARIIFDSNAHTDDSVKAARRELTKELRRRGAIVRWVDLPADLGINGVDDLLGDPVHGPDFVAELFDQAQDLDLDAWEPPTPFREYDLPEFPVKTLPSWLKSFTEQLAEEAQVPVDLPAIQSLAACATGVQRNVEIEARDGWREPLNIYTLTVMESANRKSKVVSEITRPLEIFERDQALGMRDEIAEADNEHKILEARLDKAQKDCAKLDGQELEKRKEEARELAIELSQHRVPVAPRFFIDDSTSEALVTRLYEQGGRIGLFSAEGGLFETMAGRYSNGAPNIDVYLKAHSGDTLRVDRRQRSEHIEKPALTIGLAVQGDVLKGLADKPGFRGRGLLGRFLYSRPQSRLGRRKVRTAPVSEEARRTYEQYLIKLAAIKPINTTDGPEPIVLRLTRDADDYLAAFQEEIEPKLAEGEDYSTFSDWAGKLCGAILRIAGVLHLADSAMNAPNFPREVSAGVLRRAIEIGRYLIPHAQSAYAEMGADPLIEDAKYVLRWVKRDQREELTRRDIHQGTKARFEKVTELDPVIELLVEHGYLRPLDRKDGDPGRRGRKASQLFETNPYFLDGAQNSHNSQNVKSQFVKPEIPGITQNSHNSQNRDHNGISEYCENSEQRWESLNSPDIPQFGRPSQQAPPSNKPKREVF